MQKEESPDGVSSSGGGTGDAADKGRAKGKTKKGQKWKPLVIEIKSLKEEVRSARGAGRGGRGGRGERGVERGADRQRATDGEEEREFINARCSDVCDALFPSAVRRDFFR